MPANENEKLIGFGYKKQSALGTANVLAGIWRMNNLNSNYAEPKLATENDADEMGKGHEFATAVYPTSWDIGFQIDKYLSSDWAAWVMSFGMGHVVKSGSSPNLVYTCTRLDPVTDGIELPHFSYVEQIRPGASAVLDVINIGCAVEGWALSLAGGPGRANAKLTADIIGTGKHTRPSGITMPAATSEKLLPGSSLACTINDVNYVSNKNIVSLDANWRNNHRMDSGYYPGCGVLGAQTQVDTITLTGSAGTANVTLAGGLTKLVTYGTSLTITAGAFVTSHTAAYAAVGITVTSSGPDIIFTDAVPGTGFVHPVITNATSDLAGTVANTAYNIASGSSGAIRGRLEVGNRQSGLSFVARFEYGSQEFNKLKAQVEGTAVISATYNANNDLTLTYQRLIFKSTELGGAEGIVIVKVETEPLYHTSNGLLTVVAKCNTDNIAQAES
jgi:hypothetical protein